MAGNAADETHASVRSLGGLICPRCRYRLALQERPSAGDPPDGALSASRRAGSTVERCPNDGYALIAANELSDADGDPFLGLTIAGRFVVLARLGAGSMGTVYRARQEAMARDVAVKILRWDRAIDAQAKARFTREARAMSLLASPHTVTVFDFGEIHEEPRDDLVDPGVTSLYLAMELLEGESLGMRLKRTRRVRVDAAARIARQALLSLAEAHEKGIIHRDLKPDNLFLVQGQAGEPEICKLLDFGIAKLVSETNVAADALETQAGTVFGTPRYMSPEQAQGRPLDARSDLYSLGVLLYHMLVGRPPFVDDDAVVVMARHIKTRPVPPAEASREAAVPEPLSDLVMRALAKDAAERPASAKAFIEELDQAMEKVARAAGAAPLENAEAPTGAVAAMVRDDLEEPGGRPAPSARSPRPRGGQLAAFVAAASVTVLLAALGLVRVRPERIVEARAGVARLGGGAVVAASNAVIAPASSRVPPGAREPGPLAAGVPGSPAAFDAGAGPSRAGAGSGPVDPAAGASDGGEPPGAAASGSAALPRKPKAPRKAYTRFE